VSCVSFPDRRKTNQSPPLQAGCLLAGLLLRTPG